MALVLRPPFIKVRAFEDMAADEWGYEVLVYGTGKFKHKKRPIVVTQSGFASRACALNAALDSEKLREYIANYSETKQSK